MKKILLFLISICVLTGCTKEPTFKDKDTIKIAVASDIHYFAKEYYENCDWFDEQMLYSDGKMVQHMDEILDAFFNDVIEKDVDVVLLTGDLTFDGEINSHKILAEKLEKLEENDIQVIAIAGNHDIDNIFTKGYGNEDFFDVENISASEFKKIYKNLGYDLAVSEHNQSLSYEVLLNNKYSLLVLDSNSHELTTGSSLDSGGKITDSTREWMIKRLEEDKANNRIPIVAMHHNLGIHNENLFDGYTIKDHETIVDIFKSYNVPLSLSGHIHLQSIIDVEGIKEITTSALSINPLQYGLIEINNDKITYNAQSLKINIDPIKFFETNAEHLFFSDDVSMENLDAIKDVILKANRHYFSGSISEVKDEIMKMEGYSLIMKQDDSSMYKNYLNRVLVKDGNYKELEINIK